jgi:hypothetical protein
MSETEKAAKVIDALKASEQKPPHVALRILNELAGLMQGGQVQVDLEQPLEIEEARSSAFLAICEIGKALHCGTPADHLWAPAISASERWLSLAGDHTSRNPSSGKS